MTKWLVSAAAALAVLVGAWFWHVSPSAQSDDQRPIRLGINPWPGYELLYLAQVNGYFKEEGLNIALKQFSALEDVRNAFENNAIDGMCTTLVELLQAKANSGKQGKVTLITDYSNGADEILARKCNSVMAKREGITSQEFSEAMTGLQLMDSAAQAAYFAPGGPLERTIDFTIQVLRKSNDLARDVGAATQYIHR